MTVPWTAGVTLHCTGCRATEAPDLSWYGCARCGAPFEVHYDDPDGPCLPIPPEERTDLAAQPTPTLELTSDPGVLLKLELRNPTGSHKDRFHAVTSAIARLAGARGIVTTSTGNHGVSCACHAARDGIPCVVRSTEEIPDPLAVQIAAHGAKLVRLEPGERREALRALVDDGWVPATSSDPALTGAGNPYGAEGYRAIADELLVSAGRLPDVIFVPVASGDTLLGVARGLATAAGRLGQPVPRVASCQPVGAATVSASLRAGHPVSVESPHSVARSTSDRATGRLAIEVVARSGLSITASEAEIIRATRDLAANGLYAEASSALALAGARVARRNGILGPDALAVAVLTANGRGWSETTQGVFPPPRSVASDIRELDEPGVGY